ncbi:DUF4097 family beta strand repeat-containing protein [Sporosarcina sp. G11-34]|uniref:DUF4097 family beta strand repeat-containing protein n=1 Tax=Sporosarcina sp. G11-34 TaxID=2849605 RepID=UPI0022A962E8|nr:DUF4097 family beta strand repeat-containing protein [Sporosarcina sp. G11-34]MCZ2257717.1 DUF4097 family beta strand repeat protein [Sporosarcina sp. G11-34]
MTENQFIRVLEDTLKQLPNEERNDIIQDIHEYFTNGRADGKTDSEIANSLGSPSQIAEELLASYSFATQDIPDEISNELITLQNNTYTKIDMNVQHGALVVRPSTDTVTTVELIGANEKMQLSAEVVGDTLFIRLKSLRHWLFMFNMKPVIVNVFIPSKLYQSIAMKTDNGRISARKLLGKSITANTDNGRIELNEIAASDLSTEADNGRIMLDKIQADTIKVETDNGRIEMRHIEADTISVESDNGRIEMEHVDGAITGKTDNGRITLETSSLDRNMDFRTDNGAIFIKSKSKPTNLSIYTKTGNGKIDVFGEQNSKTVIGVGENTLRLKSGNGRITVGY